MNHIPELKNGENDRGFTTLTLTAANRMTGETAAALSDALEIALDGQGYSVFARNRDATDGDDWEITLITPQKPDLARLKPVLDDISATYGALKLAEERHPEANWLEQVHRDFPPLTLGGFYVYGSHYKGPVPENVIPLNIDAATAFGSGEHETTRGCLIALENLAAAKQPVRKALDMGCGSGILAVAIKKLWPEARVLAVDIDPESVRVTLRHADMNAAHMVAEAGDGYRAPAVAAEGPYDLIAANILAGPLVDMAPDLAKHLAPGGHGVLSGLLARQEQEVTAAHVAAGLIRTAAMKINGWYVMVFQKPA